MDATDGAQAPHPARYKGLSWDKKYEGNVSEEFKPVKGL
jgi:hypothetical protein